MKRSGSRTWLNLLLQRCPRCGRGPIFRGLFTMHPDCPACGLHFEREQGYFMGALYVSYGLASAVLIFFMFIAWQIFPEWDPRWYVLLAALFYLPLVPVVFRYARVLWIYFDRWAWPANEADK